MAERPVAIVVPAGQGSRKQSDLPKVLPWLSGVALVGHALTMARTLEREHGGERTTIGAGTITCNHGGVMTHRNETGSPASIDSDTMRGTMERTRYSLVRRRWRWRPLSARLPI